jgi:acetolactate synthase-1/2/3 large subunit
MGDHEVKKSKYTGADLISDFISEKCCGTAFLVTGGACAFIVDAIGRNDKTEFVCFQHEQAAAMAADAVWRTTGKVGVTVATSGPGATNLITGIACSWFDSIPSIHITGQVNQSESRESLGANVRQAGFQETDIVSMVASITKFAKKIESVEDLVDTLSRVVEVATTGRMGPVLLDIPMNIQKAEISEAQRNKALTTLKSVVADNEKVDLVSILENATRPVVVIGAGAALAGTARQIQNWCEENSIPYVSSWGSLTYLDRELPNYFGSLGVYGARAANWLIQSADDLIIFGSRLDNRQRTGNPSGFAPFARITVLDVDREELNKYKKLSNYQSIEFNLRDIEPYLEGTRNHGDWSARAKQITSEMEEGFDKAVNLSEFNPYSAVRVIQKKFEKNAIVVSDCGANLCWVYQSYLADDSFLFTAGGNSPMGYSLPAAIGAQLLNPLKKVYCFIGDGGLQMNVQELQTIVHYNLPITVIIQNNAGYGIIKQFQDAYFGGRYFATGEGYSIPSFEKISNAYGIPYKAINSEEELLKYEIPTGFSIVDLHLPTNSLITPKTEMDRFIHDQFPYIKDQSIEKLPFEYPLRPSELSGISNPTV